MNRRTVIKNLALIIGGAALLPSCLRDDGTAYLQLKHINIDARQQKLIADIAETIIPKTATPGAMDLNLHLFVLKMLDDCYTKKDQQAFLAGLAQFNDRVTKQYNKSFGELSLAERGNMLTALEKSIKPARDPQKAIRPVRDAEKSIEPPKKKPNVPPLNLFYGAIKQQTIFGYTNSQYFMTKLVVYELVPGRYNAHFPVKNLKAV